MPVYHFMVGWHETMQPFKRINVTAIDTVTGARTTERTDLNGIVRIATDNEARIVVHTTEPYELLGLTAIGTGPFEYDHLVDARWATVVSNGHGTEGQVFETFHGQEYQVWSTLQGAIDQSESDGTTSAILYATSTTENVSFDPGPGAYTYSLIIHGIDSTGSTNAKVRLNGNFEHKGRLGSGYFLVLENFFITGTFTTTVNISDKVIGRGMQFGGDVTLADNNYRFQDCDFQDILLRNSINSYLRFDNCTANDIDGDAASAAVDNFRWEGGSISGSVTIRDGENIYIDTHWTGGGDTEHWYFKSLGTLVHPHHITIKGTMRAKTANADKKWYVLFVDQTFSKVAHNIIVDLICEKPTDTTNEVHYFESEMANAIRAANIRIDCGVAADGTKLEDMAGGYASVKGVFAQSTFMLTPCDAVVDLTGSVDGSNCVVTGDDTAGLAADADHGELDGLADDDHTQYPLVDGTRGFTGVVPGIDPTASNHLATKEYVDQAVSFIAEYYFNDTASDIAGIYFKMLDVATGEGESTFTIGAPLGQGDDQAVFNFATDQGVPGVTTLESGIYGGHIHVEKTIGTKPVKLHYEIYTRTHPGGVETLRATSEESDFITAKTSVDLHATLSSDVSINATDRIVIKWLANVDATGSNVTIALYAEGTTNSHLEVPTSTEVLSSVFLRQDGTTELTDHWDVGPFTAAATGLWNFIASGLGGLGDYDLAVGDVTTPDYGIIQIGDSLIGRTSYNVASLDLDGAFILRNMGGPVTGQIEFVFAESGGGAIRFALPKSGVGNATYNSRSMLIAGPAVNDDDIVTVGYWQGQGIFHNLVCDTSGTGADLGVQNDLEVEGDIFTDSIKESTPDAGVTIEDVLLKDGLVDGVDVATIGGGDFYIPLGMDIAGAPLTP